MKNHIIDATITPETLTTLTTAVTTLQQTLATFGVSLDETQRKHSLHIGTRNETFCREILELAQERPELVPAGISAAALVRDLVAREQLTPILFQLKALTRQVEDTHNALGIDLYNGCRALYKAIKPIALINGVADLIARICQRFARQGRRKTTPETVSAAATVA